MFQHSLSFSIVQHLELTCCVLSCHWAISMRRTKPHTWPISLSHSFPSSFSSVNVFVFSTKAGSPERWVILSRRSHHDWSHVTLLLSVRFRILYLSTIFYPGPMPGRYNLLPSCQCLHYNLLPTLTDTYPTIFYLMKTKPTYGFLLSSCSLSNSLFISCNTHVLSFILSTLQS